MLKYAEINILDITVKHPLFSVYKMILLEFTETFKMNLSSVLQKCQSYTEKNGCLGLISRCLTMGQPSYMLSCNI